MTYRDRAPGGPGDWPDPSRGGPEPSSSRSATTVLLVVAFALLVSAIPVGAYAVVTASTTGLVAAFVLAFGALGVLLACGLLAGARTTLDAHRRRQAERDAWVPPDEQIP